MNKYNNSLVVLAILALMSSVAHAEDRPTPEPSAAVDDKVDASGDVADEVDAEDDGSNDNKFDVLEFRIKGNTVLSRGEIEETIYPFLGETKSIKDVDKAREALEKKFHDKGYLTVFVNIPEQEVKKDGIVRLDVQEATVERLRVVDSHYYSLGVIKSRVPELAEGHVPFFPEMQKQLAELNTVPDRRVTPILRPSKLPGKVEAELKVADTLPVHGSLELNNRYSLNTTHTRLNGSLRYDNLWQRDHSLGISFQITPQETNQTKIFSVNYLAPLGDGDALLVYGILSDSDIAAVGDVNVIGNGTIAGVRFIRQLPSVENYSHNLTVGLDYKSLEEATDFNNNPSGSFTSPVEYLPLQASYDAVLQGERSNTRLGLDLTLSVRGLVNEQQQFNDRRFLSKSNFAIVKTRVQHTQTLFKDWQLVAKLTTQLTNEPLIPSEQFALGGSESVRGYLESNVLGDVGWTTSFELRTPSLAKYLPSKPDIELKALAFYDAGFVKVLEPLPLQTSDFNLQSIGVGLRFKGWHGFSSAIDYALALRSSGDNIESGDQLVHIKVGYEF